MEHHLNLTSRLNVYVGASREERYEADCRETGSHTSESAGNRMTRTEASDRADRSAGGHGDFRGLACITCFVLILFDGSFAILDLLFAGAREPIYNSRYFYN